MKELHAAVIGCGLISKNHLKALKNVENAVCAAVCDIVPERAKEAAKQYGIEKIYTDYHELLKDIDIDVIHICTPHYLHAQMAVDALDAGKHVLCEKPMALSKEDAERMIKAGESSGRYLGVCLQNRYNKASVMIKELLQSGEFGKVIGGRGHVVWDRKPAYYENSDWRGSIEKAGGGVLINQAIHTFDLLQWLTFPVRTVEASVSTKRLKGIIEVEDTADILMTGADGQRLVFYTSNCYVKNAPVELEIVCENGSIKMMGNIVETEKDGQIVRNDYTSGAVLGKDYWGSGHGFLIDDFYQCIESGRPFPVSAAEAFVSVQLIEAVYRSAREGITVNI